MITLAHFDWQTPIEFDKNLQCLIIENPECFYETVNKLNKAISGEDSGFILTDERQKEFVELLDCSIYSENEITDYLKNSGFSKVKTDIKKSKDSFTGDDANWICAIAQK